MPTKTQQNSAVAVTGEIENRIYVIRGKRVMLDADLAEIYGLATKVLKQKRSAEISVVFRKTLCLS